MENSRQEMKKKSNCTVFLLATAHRDGDGQSIFVLITRIYLTPNLHACLWYTAVGVQKKRCACWCAMGSCFFGVPCWFYNSLLSSSSTTPSGTPPNSCKMARVLALTVMSQQVLPPVFLDDAAVSKSGSTCNVSMR